MRFCIQPHVPGQEAMGVVQAQKSWCSGSINQRKRVSFRLRILCRNNFVFQQKTESSICPLLHTLQAYEIRAPSIVSKLLFNSVNYTQLFVCVCVCVCVSCFSRVWLFVTFWTIACQAPLSMGFPRHEYWSELPCPPSGDLPNPGIELTSLTSPALAELKPSKNQRC